MGTKHLLLVALGITVAGISIVTGVSLFNTYSVNNNRDQTLQYLYLITSDVQRYYKKPAALGGGGKSYARYQIPAALKANDIGTFTVSTAGNAARIIIQGVGVEKGDNGRAGIQYRITITPTGYTIRKMN